MLRLSRDVIQDLRVPVPTDLNLDYYSLPGFVDYLSSPCTTLLEGGLVTLEDSTKHISKRLVFSDILVESS